LRRDASILNHELLDVCIPEGVLLGAGKKEHTGLDLLVDDLQLVLPLPEIFALQVNDFWLTHRIVKCLHALLNGLHEVHAGILISRRAENAPGLQLRLSIHLALSLTVQVRAGVNVELKPIAILLLAHDVGASLKLRALDGDGLVVDFDLPILHDFVGPFILGVLKVSEQGSSRLKSLSRVALCGFRNVFHEMEVRSHLVCESCHVAALWDEVYFLFGSSVFVDDQELLGVFDLNIILALIIFQIGNLFCFFSSFILGEGMSELDVICDIIDSVHFFVVCGHHRGADHFVLDPVEVHLIVLEVLEVVEGRLDS